MQVPAQVMIFHILKKSCITFMMALLIIMTVFTIPDGPKSNIPDGGGIPNLLYVSGLLIGSKTARCNFFFNCAYPPISAQERLSMVVSKPACWDGAEFSKA